jgi:AhpC/TSA family protein
LPTGKSRANLPKGQSTNRPLRAEEVMATRMATVGTRAPTFTLPCTEGPGSPLRQVSLDDYADRWLVLLFYPRDFSLV